MHREVCGTDRGQLPFWLPLLAPRGPFGPLPSCSISCEVQLEVCRPWARPLVKDPPWTPEVLPAAYREPWGQRRGRPGLEPNGQRGTAGSCGSWHFPLSTLLSARPSPRLPSSRLPSGAGAKSWATLLEKQAVPPTPPAVPSLVSRPAAEPWELCTPVPGVSSVTNTWHRRAYAFHRQARPSAGEPRPLPPGCGSEGHSLRLLRGSEGGGPGSADLTGGTGSGGSPWAGCPGAGRGPSSPLWFQERPALAPLGPQLPPLCWPVTDPAGQLCGEAGPFLEQQQPQACPKCALQVGTSRTRECLVHLVCRFLKVLKLLEIASPRSCWCLESGRSPGPHLVGTDMAGIQPASLHAVS